MKDFTKTEINAAADALQVSVRNLLAVLIPDIGDDYRASEDPEDDTPGMSVTIGATLERDDDGAAYFAWSYQTGDNSFTGGAYGHPHWGVVGLYRDSDVDDVARDAVDQICELIAG